ncbi:glycoside hydrolase family 97 catalytic domain-containing protein [Croceibacterium sp. TMG7-5b_MA50]|uniref:glycoside hydrolase family 97 protein n=1 Tax=Croceibacterium sp. TMG7-5b_MA50 TaxID=3121290 RepID=UPI003221B890
MPSLAQLPGRAAEAVSPDGRVVVRLHPDEPAWSMLYDGREVVARSPVALLLHDGGRLGRGARVVDTQLEDLRGTWTPPFGIRASSTEACGQLTVEMEDAARQIRFALIVRAYDAGGAIRFAIRSAAGDALELAGEEIAFRLPAESVLHCSRDEGVFQRTIQTGIAPAPHPDLTQSSDPLGLADSPLTVELRNGTGLLISESDRLHYPRTMFRSDEGGVVTRLMQYPGRATGYSGPGDTPPETSFTVPAPSNTPWRVVIVAPSLHKLIERQDLIPTLATPNRLGDVSWIRPGRAMRIRDYTTQAGLETIDFAEKRKLDHVLWDAHWYGDGTDPSDASYAIPQIDIRRVIDYAKGKGIGMILYVDRVPAMRQLEQIVRTYQEWGVAGIKFGFMWEGRQSDVDFITNLVETCGRHQLMVNLHDNLRPAGLERTLPNYVTLEGVRGNEQFPTAGHNCTLPFTRMLSGPLDYTICYAQSRNKTTNAHQLALLAIYYSPQTLLYWYDKPDRYAHRDDWPELAFFDECPTTWVETVALTGTIGEHCAVARRAADGRWFAGAITNEQARDLVIDLGFLQTGRWRVRRFADGPAAAQIWQTPVMPSTEIVEAGGSMTLSLAASGGQALIFEPA